MKDNVINSVCLSISTIFTIVQTNEIMQLISLILTCIASLVAIGYNMYKWYKKSIEDGKIDDNEVNELINIIEKNDVRKK